VGNSYEDKAHISGALIDSGGRRIGWRSSPFQRAIMQHGRRDGRNGLLQGCAEQKQYTSSRQCSPVLFAELFTEWNDASERR